MHMLSCVRCASRTVSGSHLAPITRAVLLFLSPIPSIRRAMERKARKLEKKRLQAETLSEARQLSNQANAQLSTGPRSEEGRAKSSLNAVKTGLTGRTVLLPSDDVAEYERHL